MKKLSLIAIMLLINSMSVYSQETMEINPDEIEITESSDEAEETRLTIREIKSFVKTNNKSQTCLDEYLKRRNQLMTKLAITPITAVAAGAGAVYIGAAAGAGVAIATSAKDWTALGYVILGAGGGVVLSTSYALYDTTKSTLEILDNNLMIKALAEQHMNIDGPKSDRLYEKYSKKNSRALSRDEFFSELMKKDQSGELCDGSMTKKKRIQLGFKLKYKLATSKDLARKI